MDRFIFVVSII
jgi:hypothetical protein